ncbi:conserved hypothetical protein [Burkholderia cenocepacia]|nr:conserved hypothetical protein [Burkholderia cenocepacia]
MPRSPGRPARRTVSRCLPAAGIGPRHTTQCNPFSAACAHTEGCTRVPNRPDQGKHRSSDHGQPLGCNRVSD